MIVGARPTVEAMQKWADEVGDESYTWDKFLPWLQKSAKYTSPNQAMYTNASNTEDPAGFSPSGGPLQVSFSNSVDSFGTWARKAFIQAGMNQLPGLNTGKLIGSAYATLTVDPRNGHRSSSESSFLQAALQNGSAPVVYKNSFAKRIIFSSNNTATGVEVTTAGPYGIPAVNYTLTARKEVIVSGGAFQSPQLLMVSGIGPKDTLSKYNIPVVKDLPGVGLNMWDHVSFGVTHKVNVLTASAAINNATLGQHSVKLFLENGTGPLSIFGAGYYGFENLPEPYRSNLTNTTKDVLAANFPADWPELEWLPISSYTGNVFNRQKADPKDGSNYAQLNCAVVSPMSRGNVTIQSADMGVPPLINPNWLVDPADKELAVQAVKRQRQLWAYLTSQGLTNGVEVLPGANVTTDADILDFISRVLIQVYHAAGTCKMGRRNDTTAVVDSSGKVFGTQNLRVVDASSMPFLPPGHPQSTIYALAEKFAAEIMNLAPGEVNNDFNTSYQGPQAPQGTLQQAANQAAQILPSQTLVLGLIAMLCYLYL